MPRLARLDAPGVLHRVMGRGIERSRIFWDDCDKEDFIRRLAEFVSKKRHGGYMDIYMNVDAQPFSSLSTIRHVHPAPNHEDINERICWILHPWL
jgi:hypothetical protein